jgi:hypothetical protein
MTVVAVLKILKNFRGQVSKMKNDNSFFRGLVGPVIKSLLMDLIPRRI